MITLNNITKRYENLTVLEGFTYSFEEHGFYLLFGSSGCGKTTLIDIIAGIIDFDEGQYLFQSVQITGKQNQSFLQHHIAYIAQNDYFIDYLTIKENLELVAQDTQIIYEYMEKFGLTSLLDEYPNVLSGGQRQRIAIMQALVSNKDILILDEPTSSLDQEGKVMIFELLKEISKDHLVICVSHDRDAIAYADHMIDFLHLPTNENVIVIEDIGQPIQEEEKKRPLYPYVKNYARYKKREKKSIVMMFLIYTLFFLLVMATIDLSGKISKSIIEDYHMNYLEVRVPNDLLETYVKDTETEYEGANVVYQYNPGGDYIERQGFIDGTNTEDSPYTTADKFTIPTTNFYYQDFIAYGTYFNEANEIMLGFEKAKKISNDPASLIGQEMIIDTSRGKESFTISGIFKEFKEKELPYFENGYQVEYLNDLLYMNERYTNQYLYDDMLSYYEKETHRGSFYVYFDNVNDLYQYLNLYSSEENIDSNIIYALPLENGLYDVISQMEDMLLMLYPFMLIAVLIILFFYAQTKIFELHQNLQTFCIYLYYGYGWKEILSAYRRLYAKELMVVCVLSFGLSTLIAFGVNLCDFTTYPLFSIHLLVLAGISFLLFAICYLNIYFLLRKIKKVSWYDIIRERRDLL